MARVIMAEGCREIDAGGRRHYAQGGAKGYQQGGLFEMSDRAAKLAVKAGAAIASVGGAARGRGWVCTACGFRAFIKTCGRCGGECVRE
jgi:hypothetical protein